MKFFVRGCCERDRCTRQDGRKSACQIGTWEEDVHLEVILKARIRRGFRRLPVEGSTVRRVMLAGMARDPVTHNVVEFLIGRMGPEGPTPAVETEMVAGIVQGQLVVMAGLMGIGLNDTVMRGRG